MEATRFMELYDSCWFEMEILKKQTSLSKSSRFEANPDGKNEEKTTKQEVSRLPTLITRSMSDQLASKLSLNSAYSVSPDSVLLSPKLHTILSGKEISELEENLFPTQSVHIQESPKPKKKAARRRRRGKKTLSKSLSELEFEELKGFMDLGFVFSEADKDSSLVSIIPGLQRLGMKDEEKEEVKESVDEDSAATVSRPYLSEAWEVLDRRRKENPLMNWRIPSMGNEIDIKDNLRWWAHTVASTVR